MKKKFIYAAFAMYVVATVAFIIVRSSKTSAVTYKENPQKYEEQSIKVFHDSKGRSHRVAVLNCGAHITAVDIDATTYLEGDTTNVLNKKK